MRNDDPLRAELHRSARRFQFTLETLLVATGCCAGLLAAWKVFGISGVAFLLAWSVVALLLWNARTRSFGALGLVLVLMATCGFLFLPASRTAHETRTPSCRNNLRNIALALFAYEQRNGSLPPAYTTDDQGQPLHSWRTLILPYLERNDLYDAIYFDEPWDSPHNRQVTSVSMDIFCCPLETGQPVGATNYLAVVGPHTVWPGSQGRAMTEITDGLQNTILLVEVHNSGIHWAEPRDLHVTQMAPGINPAVGQGPSSLHPGGINVAYADSHVQFLGEADLTAEEFAALLTIDGDEVEHEP